MLVAALAPVMLTSGSISDTPLVFILLATEAATAIGVLLRRTVSAPGRA